MSLLIMEKNRIKLKKEALSDRDILQSAQELLIDKGMLTSREAGKIVSTDCCSKVDSDGSTRRFWRVKKDHKPFCLIAAPAGQSRDELAESRSAWEIGSHLWRNEVPVPELFGWDSNTGVLLFEDLGDTRLHDLVLKEDHNQDSVIACYQATLEHLAAMQCRGAEGFQQSWCWDSGRYDIRVMVEKESGYFLRAFWQGLLAHSIVDGVQEELLDIARLAAEAPADFFLHRDFQSRNIMIKEGAVRFIDFQGGRLGPLGYDLASLLIDPYCNLSELLQEKLVAHYLKSISTHIIVDEAEFKKQFMLLAFQRNIQIVGAFSFLYKVRRKVFFLDFIKPSLMSLRNRLEDPLFKDYPLIRTMVNKGLKELASA